MAVSVPRNKIVIDEPARLGFIGNDAIEAAMIATQQSSAKSKRSASLAVVVTLTDLGLLSRVQDFLAQKDVVTLESPLFELTDSRAARRAAIADAIQKARADAEAYAASLGMRVTRITAIKDQIQKRRRLVITVSSSTSSLNRKTSPKAKLKPMFEWPWTSNCPRSSGSMTLDIRRTRDFLVAF